MKLAVNYDIKTIISHAIRGEKTVCGRKINFEREKTNFHQGWYLQEGSREQITCKVCKRALEVLKRKEFDLAEENL